MGIWNREDHVGNTGPSLSSSQGTGSRAGPAVTGVCNGGAAGQARSWDRPGRRRVGPVAAKLWSFTRPPTGDGSDPAANRPRIRGHRTRRTRMILDTNALSAVADGDPAVDKRLI